MTTPAHGRETPTCILCDAPDLKRVYAGQRLEVRECGCCSLVVGKGAEHGELDGDAVATDPHFYDSVIEDFDRLTAENAAMLGRRRPIYREMFGLTPRKWLEIGPGSGAFGRAASDAGDYWRGIEIEPAMASRMKSLGLNVVHGDFTTMGRDALPPEASDDGGYDAIYFTQVLEHVPYPRAFLESAFRVLKPGGILHVDVPNNDGLTAHIRRMRASDSGFGEVTPPHHMIAYGKKALGFALRQANFEVRKVFASAYDDATFGVAHARLEGSMKMRAVWQLSAIIGMGGNLTGLAQKPLD